MAMMKWTKPAAATIDYFERIAPGPPIEARRMFGMPSRFLNGHMLVSVFGNSLMLHLSETDREECIAAGAAPFAPHGRSAAEYVEIQIGHFEDRTLKEWIARGMRYLGSLPPRLAKPAAKRATLAPASSKGSAKPRASKAKAKAKAKAVAKKKPAAPTKPTAKKAAPKKAASKRAAPIRAKRAAKKAAQKKAAAKTSSAKKSRSKKRR